MDRFLTPLTWLVVIVAAVVPLTSATSDPKAMHCGEACETFHDVSNQCSAQRGCYDYASDDPDAFKRCVEQCSELSYSCANLCWNEYQPLMTQCYDQCKGNDDFSCQGNCFQTKFGEMRDSQLTLPSPDIGPFQP